MNKKTFLAILTLFGIGYFVIRGRRIEKSFRNPKVDISKIGKVKIKGEYLYLTFDLVVENPNDFSVSVQSVDLSVTTSKGKELGNVRNLSMNVPVNAKSTAKITDLQSKIGLFDTLSFLLSDSDKSTYNIVGDIKINSITLPINKTLTT